MADDYDKIAELIRNGYSIDDALNQVPQVAVPLATAAEVATGTTSKVPPVSTLWAHQGMCKVWVNFNGTGTVAIRDSYNVSSITDNGVGDYTINFTTSLSNDDYAVAFGTIANCCPVIHSEAAQTVSSVRILTPLMSNAIPVDYAIVTVALFGD